MPNHILLGLGNFSIKKSLHKKIKPHPIKSAAIIIPVIKNARCIVIVI